VELVTYRRKGHAEHDNQSYVPEGEIEWWEKNNDPLDRFVRVLLEDEQEKRETLEKIDARVHREIDEATDEAEKSPMPEAGDALVGIYADPPRVAPLWFREGVGSAVSAHERPESWGTFDD
jgi:pyruvate dehydrogenase E1 component alpha subunit/2-oxoisovalerate dehydrogenase E1 component alpha subunit